MQAKQPAKIERPERDRLPALIESLLFVAAEPQEIGTLAKSLNATRQGVERAVEELIAANGRGLFVQRMGDRVQLATVPEAAPYIEHFLEVEHGRLSRASLETLAIVAYRQPITRAGIEGVRGVNSDHSVATLVARGLIAEQGRSPALGRPVLFGTTVRFLEYFGLQRPEDMPRLPDLEEPEGVETLAVDKSGDEAQAAAPDNVEAEAGPLADEEPHAVSAEDSVPVAGEVEEPQAEQTDSETSGSGAAEPAEVEIPAECAADPEPDAVSAEDSEPAAGELEDSPPDQAELETSESSAAEPQPVEQEHALG